ncbi:hypothetical protein N7452_001347 [Penicillium brevicompactum]|uniref:Uncharacterized protein n=1 Tax=Penicillium brevicompactum TaxID=5074 RepID=A0A9W9UP52_PENBR|nr:hypothetical protein N7452_001347 [Penicillium brevicompactum]
MRIPRTLRNLSAYFRYLDMGAAGILQLPAYELDNDGYIILYPGEAFCRVAGCPGRRHRYTSSRALRAHLSRHHLRL